MIEKIEKEKFLIKQDYYKSKETIEQLNTSNKCLLKSVNKFMKLQISFKT